MTRQISKKLSTDFLWYLAGSFIPALVGIIRLPVFTRYFTPEEFGYYSLVTITFTYLSMALFNWISSCLWRYYTTYRNSGKLIVLYSNLAFLFIITNVVLVAISIIWIILCRNDLLMRLIGGMMTYVIVNQLVSFILIIYRLRKKAFFFNLLISFQALFAFCMTLLMIFAGGYRIEAIPFAQAVIASVLLVLLISLNAAKILRLSFRYISVLVQKQMIQYGFVGVIASTGLLILATSDRYIIALFSPMATVGIYNQVYQLGQVSIYFLVTLFFNTVNPSLIRIFTKPDRRNERILKGYIQLFVFLVIPAATYLSLFSKQVSAIMLGNEFQEGYPMIPFIMFSSLLYGLTIFSETRLKFLGLYRPVIVSIATACLINIVLNFVLIPSWGYQSAALTTFAAYLMLFFLMYKSDPLHFLNDTAIMKNLSRIAAVIFAQIAIDLIIRKVLSADLNILWTIIEGSSFAAMYALFAWRIGFTGKS